MLPSNLHINFKEKMRISKPLKEKSTPERNMLLVSHALLAEGKAAARGEF